MAIHSHALPETLISLATRPWPALLLATLVGFAGCALDRSDERFSAAPAAEPAQPAQPAQPAEPAEPAKPAESDEILVVGEFSAAGAQRAYSVSAPSSNVAQSLRAMGYIGGSAATEPDWNTERYDAVPDSGFLDPLISPLSTFGVDVDTASYANVRRMLRDGQLPPGGAVRIEEMLNYFSYDYPEPEVRDDTPFAVQTELTRAPWAEDHWLVSIGLQSRRADPGEGPRRNLVFLLDVSGSMQSSDKLPLIKRALANLTRQLRSDDRVALVVYAGSSGLVLPPTPGSDRDAILEALSRLTAGGSTNGGEGIRLAYRLAREHFDDAGINRVILATDGDFNVGTTSRSDLIELIEKERESGVFLTVLGVGTGNLNDSGMEQLADHGNGNYAYLDSLSEAHKVLVEQAGSTLQTVAKDVKVQVEFNPDHVAGYRLIGYENRALAARDFNDDRKDAGEIGAGHSVTALYEIVPSGFAVPGTGTDPLRYQQERSSRGGSGELLTVKLRFKEPQGDESQLRVHRMAIGAEPPTFEDASEDLRFASAVAMFGMRLRDSEYDGSSSFEHAADIARGALGRDPRGLRGEFVELARRAGGLEEMRAGRAGANEFSQR